MEFNNSKRMELINTMVTELPVLRARIGASQADISEKIGISIMIDKNILLEVNTSSLNDSCDEPMPSYSVINRYVQLGGNKIVIGSDAHSSDRLSGHFRDVVPRLPNRIQIGYFREISVRDKYW